MGRERHAEGNGKSNNIVDPDFGKRSQNYRAVFFKNAKPAFGNMYFCAYCGRLVRRKKITVDHIFPVCKVSNNARLQRFLKWRGYESVNDKRNLCAACRRCNEKKGVQMGIWIVRGLIGRHRIYWVLRLSARFIVMTSALFSFSITLSAY